MALSNGRLDEKINGNVDASVDTLNKIRVEVDPSEDSVRVASGLWGYFNFFTQKLGEMCFRDTISAADLNETLGGFTAGDIKETAIPWGGNAPDGWLFCNGEAISRTAYSALFEAISTEYGEGDGTDTFNLPDKRGVVTAGLSNMGGTDDRGLLDNLGKNTLGAVFGSKDHTLTVDEIPSHRHGVPRHKDAGATNVGDSFASEGPNNNFNFSEVKSDYEGGGESHANVQPTTGGIFLIKT